MRGRLTRGGRLRRGLTALAVSLALAGCSFSNLAFVTDTRLHFTAPVNRDLVKLPVTLRWTMRDFTVLAPGTAAPSSSTGYFALFVDQAPIRPGQTLRAVASGNNSCLHTPGCPNAAYLADRGVYTTASTSFTLTQVASLNAYQNVQLHTVTVVLLNSAGHRIGESAWYVSFRLAAPVLG
ncbi:MAG: hypothetical protein ACYDB7_10645 [Mycobacteriales bacterium]